ncbi:hypothetical protein F1642_05315 [Paracoccus sp. NBH48]|uniref:hypothetical protein n=1 Tax=Paracoccus sp. NBH48 TaxID=2596918 RepID=UPI001890D2B5|nr:hypothetical protein [Paracoccus sp. NBH48]MBF5078580.1 hypothetical protein [Paracoccus sp. NBH48]
MADTALQDELLPGQFAFQFTGTSRVDAKHLGKFLERAASVANQKGVSLYVDATREGSLVVVLSAAKKEFLDKPVATTSAVVAAMSIVVPALVFAMSIESGTKTPLTKAGIELLETRTVETIEVVTREDRFLVMDREISASFQEIETRTMKKFQFQRPALVEMQAPAEMMEMIADGSLTGRVADLEGDLYFFAGRLPILYSDQSS